MMHRKITSALSKTLSIFLIVAVIIAVAGVVGTFYVFQSIGGPANPVKIGFAISLTGGTAGSGKASLVAMQLWAEDVNKRGGLLGRPVELIYYDDKSDPATVPGLYEKLITVDKVDLVVSGYGSPLIAAAMPVVMKYGKVFVTNFQAGINEHFKYDKFFTLYPSGPDPWVDASTGFFEIVKKVTPRPKTIAMLNVANEFGENCIRGAEILVKRIGDLEVVLKESYPPTTVEFVPLMSKVKALNPDIVFICSFPTDSVGIVKASKEIGLAPKIFGGFMVGLQLASIQTQLGPALNGLIVHHTYVPAPKMKFPGVEDVLARYQRQAREAGVDPLGWYNAPYAYAMMQVLEAGVRGCGCLDDAKIADWIKNHEIETVVGKIRFAPNGEWAKPRTLFIQFQNIRSADLSEFANPDKIVILWPEEYKSGEIIYPFPGWR
jgi:branched-chain amino acid transport system substrate-binding protein